ncbi:MAG: bifunctional diaminohydroxyphosphoribosylaminopyrimidine deaminase/5-amino-6-(5-phosphoribosylamino)uracil reductase RibD [Betaproteobacteria bacterium]|nr:bifunctional diaminohydroxyphosphoribosylaminopyrimidine deaminase/5-amino-6-(5-phosphoribosylamino)uracil reductase RibD [Betaproteobacteria bacterium]
MIERALELAAQARLTAPPNPAVGCVLVNAEGRVIGEGYTQRTGGAHAEIMALRDAQARGHATQGASAYVTLEPCAHHGRTGPCCEALVQAGVSRVIASLVDPNPKVAGRGLDHLRAAGIRVEVGPGAEQARELNLGFFSRMVRGRPWMRMKVAASLDGTSALGNGQSQWITSPQARADGHAWRARACAVLTGIGTVLTDDPALTVREVVTDRQPVRVIIDSRLQTPPHARLLQGGGPVWIYCALSDPQRQAPLLAQGAQIICLPDSQGKVDLQALGRDLAQREINEVHVEAGSKLNGSLMQAGLIDELLLYLAPVLLGPGQGLMALPALQRLDQGQALQFLDLVRTGPDLRLRARLQGREHF